MKRENGEGWDGIDLTSRHDGRAQHVSEFWYRLSGFGRSVPGVERRTLGVATTAERSAFAYATASACRGSGVHSSGFGLHVEPLTKYGGLQTFFNRQLAC